MLCWRRIGFRKVSALAGRRSYSVLGANSNPVGLPRLGSQTFFVKPYPTYFQNQVRFHSDDPVPEDAPSVNFSFISKDGTEIPVTAKVGQNLLRVAQRNDVELEGACECSLACSTCHVILEHEVFDALDEPSEKEEDMLDLAYGLTETSRLGCQIKIFEGMEGTKVKLPKATRNFYVDGHVPQPH